MKLKPIKIFIMTPRDKKLKKIYNTNGYQLISVDKFLYFELLSTDVN